MANLFRKFALFYSKIFAFEAIPSFFAFFTEFISDKEIFELFAAPRCPPPFARIAVLSKPIPESCFFAVSSPPSQLVRTPVIFPKDFRFASSYPAPPSSPPVFPDRLESPLHSRQFSHRAVFHLLFLDLFFVFSPLSLWFCFLRYPIRLIHHPFDPILLHPFSSSVFLFAFSFFHPFANCLTFSLLLLINSTFSAYRICFPSHRSTTALTPRALTLGFRVRIIWSVLDCLKSSHLHNLGSPSSLTAAANLLLSSSFFCVWWGVGFPMTAPSVFLPRLRALSP